MFRQDLPNHHRKVLGKEFLINLARFDWPTMTPEVRPYPATAAGGFKTIDTFGTGWCWANPISIGFGCQRRYSGLIPKI